MRKKTFSTRFADSSLKVIDRLNEGIKWLSLILSVFPYLDSDLVRKNIMSKTTNNPIPNTSKEQTEERRQRRTKRYHHAHQEDTRDDKYDSDEDGFNQRRKYFNADS